MSTTISCDICGANTNERYIPAKILMDRGSNIIVGGGWNNKELDLCESCFEVISKQILDSTREDK